MAKEEKTNTPETVGNQFGYLCPKCESGEWLRVAATTVVKLWPDGTEDDGDHEWDGSSGAFCNCGWAGSVSNLRVLENFEAD